MAGRKKRDGPVNYFELPRKQLQTLCKKYGYPANKTNQLMAEFLTAHLNSEEYLNRDQSCPSPAVKTRFQRPDDEVATEDNLPSISESEPAATEDNLPSISESGPAVTEDNLPSTSESEPAAAETEARSVPNENTIIGEVMQTDSKASGRSPSREGTTGFTPSGFRIRDACLNCQGGSDQDTSSLPPSNNTEELTESASGLPSTSVEVMDSTSTSCGSLNISLESQKEQHLETPLPLSTMPYICPVTPDSGVKLFVDLKSNDSSPAENGTKYFGAWEAQLASTAPEMRDEVTMRASKALEGSDTILESDSDKVSSRMDAQTDGGDLNNRLLQASIASTSSKKADAFPLKSCLLTPNRRASPLSVSFLCPPVFSSPRVVNGVVVDAERSVVVKEWNSDQEQPIGGIFCSEEEKAANGALLQHIDETLQSKEASELNKSTPKSTADLESPTNGVVEQVVKMFEEKRLTSGPSSIQRAIQRKDTFKASPFLKSSRLAAELERASKVGQTRRGGVLAMKRAMGVAPIFSDSPNVDEGSLKASNAASSSDGFVDTASVAIQVDGIQETGVSPNDMDITIQILSSPVPGPLLSCVDSQGEDKTMSTATVEQAEEAEIDEDEQMVTEMASKSHNFEENNGADGAVTLPATVEESVANLSWMTKPIQLPTRRPVHQKLKEKPGRPFSANGRTLELMERASAKLKMKKNAAERGTSIPSRYKTGTTTIAAGRVRIGGEPVHEKTVTQTNAEHPPAILETIAAPLPSKETSSDWEIGDSPCSPQTEEGILSIVGNEAGTQNSFEVVNSEVPLSIAVEEELNDNERPDAPDGIESGSLERHSACEDSSTTEQSDAKEPTTALGFLDIDFTKISVSIVVEGPPPETALATESAKVLGRIAPEKCTPLSPLCSNRRETDSPVENSPHPSTPTKPSGVLVVVSERDENNTADGFSPNGKENEWSKRQEQHKTPLTGRSKEKALRTAEKKATNLREQLLRKRRGMMEQLTCNEDDVVESIRASPLKQLAWR